MKTRTAAALAALAAAACTRDLSGPPPLPTTAAPPSAHTAAPASPTVELKPGPHSPLADVDLPAGVAFAGNSSRSRRSQGRQVDRRRIDSCRQLIILSPK